MIPLLNGLKTVIASGFVFGVLSSLVAAACYPRLAGLGTSVLAKLFGWLPIKGRADLTNCTWTTTFEVESTRFPKEVTDDQVKIRQFGNRVFIKFHAANLEFFAEGVIDGGRYLTGNWRDRIEGGYHGAFQLIIDPVSRNMAGRWIGYSSGGVVKQGIWVWTRKTPQSLPVNS
jgi:hypothetical protein